jgi:hypothetical protein
VSCNGFATSFSSIVGRVAQTPWSSGKTGVTGGAAIGRCGPGMGTDRDSSDSPIEAQMEILAMKGWTKRRGGGAAGLFWGGSGEGGDSDASLDRRGRLDHGRGAVPGPGAPELRPLRPRPEHHVPAHGRRNLGRRARPAES